MTGAVLAVHAVGAAADVVGPASAVPGGAVGVLAAFVAINTVMYVALAVAKCLPRIHPGSWFNGRNRRTQNRSIHPDASDLDA